jgi:hypothetical protein
MGRRKCKMGEKMKMANAIKAVRREEIRLKNIEGV